MRLKTLCACLTLVTYAGIAMEPSSNEETRATGEGKATAENKSGPVDQTNLENLSREELLKVIADLQQQIKTHEKVRDELSQKNEDLQQQVKTHESVLAETLDQTIHTKDEEVLKEQYDQLIAAVKSEDIEKLKSLIDQGVDIDETVYGRFSPPLALAVKRGYRAVIEFLLNNGADPNVADTDGCSMLSIALKEGHLEIVKLFLSDSDNRPTLDLLYAGKYKKPMSKDDIIKVKEKLISFKHYNSPDKFGNTPLMYAISSKKISDEDRIKIVRFLLKKKKVTINHTVLTYAKRLKKNEIVKLLEDQKIRDVRIVEHNDIQSSTDNGKSPVVRLYEYCQRKDTPYRLSDLEFDCVTNNKGEFNYILGIGGKKFNQNAFHKSKKEAKNAIAKYALNVLKQEDSVTDNKNPLIKLYKYLKTKYNLSDVNCIYETNNDRTFNCIIQIRNRGYNLNLHCKTKEEAKDMIAEHVYNLLKAEAENGGSNSSD